MSALGTSFKEFVKLRTTPMQRIAILIDASSVPGEKHLKGVIADMTNVKNYLESPTGGAWLQNEILTVSHPTKNELLKVIRDQRTKDYVYVHFSGHGYHDATNEQSVVILNKDEEAYDYELNAGCDRTLILMDSCRNIEPIAESRKITAFVESTTAAWSLHRQLFDEKVLECDKGPIYIYSCDIDESAGDTPSGGLFTYNFFNCARNWYASQKPGDSQKYDCCEGYQCATALIKVKRPQQNPKLIIDRRRRYFPIAIKP